MTKIVFVLGAGASAEDGGPLIGDLLKKARAIRDEPGLLDPKEDKYFGSVFDTINALQVVQSKVEINLRNVEDVFATLEFRRLIGQPPAREVGDLEHHVEALKFAIARTVEESIRFMPRQRNDGVFADLLAPRVYGEFVDALKTLRERRDKCTVSVISFNYDLGLDCALFRAGLGPDYCLRAPAPGDGHGHVKLLKLHGSLNWAEAKPKGGGTGQVVEANWNQVLLPIGPHPEPPKGPLRLRLTKRWADHFVIPDDVDLSPGPFIVPPTWSKVGYYHSLAPVWAQAAVELRNADEIHVIGYSFQNSDAFFRFLFGLGTGESGAHLELHVYDPSSAVEERFRRMLGVGLRDECRFHQKRFGDATRELHQNWKR